MGNVCFPVKKRSMKAKWPLTFWRSGILEVFFFLGLAFFWSWKHVLTPSWVLSCEKKLFTKLTKKNAFSVLWAGQDFRSLAKSQSQKGFFFCLWQGPLFPLDQFRVLLSPLLRYSRDSVRENGKKGGSRENKCRLRLRDCLTRPGYKKSFRLFLSGNWSCCSSRTRKRNINSARQNWIPGPAFRTAKPNLQKFWST